MVKQLWELAKSCGLLFQHGKKDEREFRSSDCKWKFAMKTTTLGQVQVLQGNLRCLVLSDLHSPFFYPPAVSLAIKIGKLVNPHLVILNGDFVDCFSISPYRWDARRQNLHKEIEVSRELLSLLTKSFPQSVFIFLEGNHELFLQRYIHKFASALADLEELQLPSLLNFKGKNQFYLGYEKEYSTYSTTAFPTLQFFDAQNELRLLVIHGDGLGISVGAVHYARLVLQRTLVNTICGHWHVSQSWHGYSLEGGRISAWVFPPLCFPRPHWRNSLWGLGVGYFTLSENGLLLVETVDFVVHRNQRILVAQYGGKILTEELDDENILAH